MLIVASKCSRELIKNAFNVYALQHINCTKLVNNRYLEPCKKNRTHNGRSVFLRHLRGKVGAQKRMSDREFLRSCRMNRKSFKKLAKELKSHHNFNNPKKTPEKNEVKTQEHLLHFLNFVGTFGDSSSNANSLRKYEKGAGAHENHRNHVAEAIIDEMMGKYCYWPDEDERKEMLHETF